jgi:hypothetical protein
MDPSYYARGLRILYKHYIDSCINDCLYVDVSSPYASINWELLNTAEKRQVIMESIDLQDKCVTRRNNRYTVKMHINYSYAVMEHNIRKFEQYIITIVADAGKNEPLDKKYFGLCVFLPEINNMLILLDNSVNDALDAANTLVSCKRKFRE